VEAFLNNQSVGAALGAFLAFLLVMATDWWREMRTVRSLRSEIEVHRADAEAKLETARRMRAVLREHNKATPSPVMRFNTTVTRQVSAEVRHRLLADQRRSLEALLYTMEAIDGIFADSQTLSRHFSSPIGQAERMSYAAQLAHNWSDTVANLKRLIEMCDMYLAGRYAELVTKQFDHADYEEH
jgi:hypothetical protein